MYCLIGFKNCEHTPQKGHIFETTLQNCLASLRHHMARATFMLFAPLMDFSKGVAATSSGQP